METQIERRSKIFLVDDAAPIRARLGDMLRKIGGVIVVGEAESVSSAIEGISRTRPQYVVLDIRLIDGSGIDLLRKLKPIHPEIVFIMLTNQSEPQYRKVCLANGANYFLDKSSEFEKITVLLQELHAHSHANIS